MRWSTDLLTDLIVEVMTMSSAYVQGTYVQNIQEYKSLSTRYDLSYTIVILAYDNEC